MKIESFLKHENTQTHSFAVRVMTSLVTFLLENSMVHLCQTDSENGKQYLNVFMKIIFTYGPLKILETPRSPTLESYFENCRSPLRNVEVLFS